MELYSQPFTVINVSERDHVIVPNVRSACSHPGANYKNTGQALYGVLYKGESLKKWMERTNKGGKIDQN